MGQIPLLDYYKYVLNKYYYISVASSQRGSLQYPVLVSYYKLVILFLICCLVLSVCYFFIKLLYFSTLITERVINDGDESGMKCLYLYRSIFLPFSAISCRCASHLTYLLYILCLR